MNEPETWTTVVAAHADCTTCGAYLEGGSSTNERRRLRTWARHHAETQPGHHTIVEVTTGRSYRAAPTSPSEAS